MSKRRNAVRPIDRVKRPYYVVLQAGDVLVTSSHAVFFWQRSSYAQILSRHTSKAEAEYAADNVPRETKIASLYHYGMCMAWEYSQPCWWDHPRFICKCIAGDPLYPYICEAAPGAHLMSNPLQRKLA